LPDQTKGFQSEKVKDDLLLALIVKVLTSAFLVLRGPIHIMPKCGIGLFLENKPKMFYVLRKSDIFP